MKGETKTIVKIAVAGAILAVAVDYFISPATKSAVGLR